MPDVPCLCHYHRATSITDVAPCNEIVRFRKVHRDKVATLFNALSYFDGVNLAARRRSRGFFAVGLMDLICPPSTIFAAYNHFAGPKDIRVYYYNGHEGGSAYQTVEQVKFLMNLGG